MIIDMHVHSDVSDDGMASVETYMKWLTKLRRNYRIDGIVFTEHRLFNSEADYEDLVRQYDILIFKGTEADTDCGHVLCYGINEKIAHHFDLKNVHLSGRELINAMEDAGGIGIPAHPGRRHIGLVEHLENGYDIGHALRAVEQLNGGSSKQENARAQPRRRAPALWHWRQRCAFRQRRRQIYDGIQTPGPYHAGSGGAIVHG